MKRWLYNKFIKGHSFEKEFRNQLRLFISFTLGFTIAFTWRQTIFDLSQSFISLLTHIESSSALSFLSSSLITLVSLILIYISSIYLKEKY